MKERERQYLLFCLPQLVTGSRLLLGGLALWLALDGQLALSACLISLGAATDGLDGPLARSLRVPSDFGSHFDYYADYVCYVIAPWALSVRILAQPVPIALLLPLCVPLLTGAIRYSRNVILLKTEDFEVIGFPGLGTCFYAFFVISVALLRGAGLSLDFLSSNVGALVFTGCVLALSVLMLAPVRYPKLGRSKPMLAAIVAWTAFAPFLFSQVFGAVTLILVAAYAVISPWLFAAAPRKEPARPPVRERLVHALLGWRISRCLTGRPGDLRRLLSIPRIAAPGPALKLFVDRLNRDLEQRTGLGAVLLHIGRHGSRRFKRKLARNLILNWAVKGARIRTSISRPDRWAPFFITVSPSMRCNLKCHGCYSALYTRDGELSESELDRIFAQCKEIGAYFTVVSGGEPYLLKDRLLRLFRKHGDMFFLTFTNATLLDAPLVKELGRLGNVAPAISVEGYEDHTDRRRSRGVYAKVLNAMRLLKEQGVVFGISVTYTRENIPIVTDDRFIEFYLDKGAGFAWYFMFMPVGKDPVLELVPTPEQRLECGQRVAELRKRHPLFMADFWNDGVAAGGCLAGGRRYLHILNSGRVEPCVFAHFGTDNIREKTLLEAANSPFFQAIRREFPFNELGNLRRPCMIIDNPEVLRKVVAQYATLPGHDQSEDLVKDDRVRGWMDQYAARMKELTEGDWRARIEDPASRWYKENKEYKNLFRFQKPGQASR